MADVCSNRISALARGLHVHPPVLQRRSRACGGYRTWRCSSGCEMFRRLFIHRAATPPSLQAVQSSHRSYCTTSPHRARSGSLRSAHVALASPRDRHRETATVVTPPTAAHARVADVVVVADAN